MKVLLLNYEKGWRGGERQTLYALQGLKEAGVTAHLVCRKSSYLEQYARRDGYLVHAFESTVGVAFFLIAQGKNYDCIHTQTSHLLTYCVLTKPFFKAPVFFTRRVDFMPKGSITRLKYRLANKIIAVSETIKSIVSKFSGRDDIEVISDVGMKTEANIAIAKEKLASLDIGTKHIIATTAALTGHKDPLVAVEAIKKLSEKRKDFVFLHFGSGELHEAVTQAIAKHGLQDFYKLMGFVENVENFFPLFEVFIMTSQEEGLGSSVLDAFLNKVPVVSTDAGGLKELLRDDRGVLCKIKDSEAIASGIDFMLSNTTEKEKFINNAFVYVNHYHSLKYITQKNIDLMKNYAPNRK